VSSWRTRTSRVAVAVWPVEFAIVDPELVESFKQLIESAPHNAQQEHLKELFNGVNWLFRPQDLLARLGS
jgi:hypothetical protein